MSEIALLARRAIREIVRLPESTIPTLVLPLSFLAVTVGQISRSFPAATGFLHNQGYVAFQLPMSLLFGVCTATSGFVLVNDIDRGYFDKLLLAPIRRSSIVVGRLAADFVRGAGVSTLVLLAALALGAHMRTGILGAVALIVLASLWGVAVACIAMLIALRTRNVPATSASFLIFIPLLFLTPTYVPFDRLTSAMQAPARANPVSYVVEALRALVLEGWIWSKLALGGGVILASGAILIALTVRAIHAYDH